MTVELDEETGSISLMAEDENGKLIVDKIIDDERNVQREGDNFVRRYLISFGRNLVELIHCR
ncbi:MAG: hypothetical protein ABL899_02420 [Nitrospira sp.]